MLKKEPTPPKEILDQIEKLAADSPPRERRRALLNAFLNLALIPDTEFVAINLSRADTLLVVYEEILLWN